MFKGFFSWLSGSGGSSDDDELDMGTGCDINPANGLPMVSDGGVDVGGNAYGTDSLFDDSSTSMDMGFSDDTWASPSISDDSSSFSSDDSFSFDSSSSWDD